MDDSNFMRWFESFQRGTKQGLDNSAQSELSGAHAEMNFLDGNKANVQRNIQLSAQQQMAIAHADIINLQLSMRREQR